VQILLERATYPLLFLVSRARNGETDNGALPLADEVRQSRVDRIA
jgi:hypothetical protein